MLIEPGFICPEKSLGYGEASNGPSLRSGSYVWDCHGEAKPLHKILGQIERVAANLPDLGNLPHSRGRPCSRPRCLVLSFLHCFCDSRRTRVFCMFESSY
jgi:hypothetical protein